MKKMVATTALLALLAGCTSQQEIDRRIDAAVEETAAAFREHMDAAQVRIEELQAENDTKDNRVAQLEAELEVLLAQLEKLETGAERFPPEAEAQAEGIAAAEEATVAAQQQAAADQVASNANSMQSTETAEEARNSGSSGSDAQKLYAEEPSSGIGKERANRVGATWIPELEGWAYITETGEYVLIRVNGASRSLTAEINGTGENLAIAKRYLG